MIHNREELWFLGGRVSVRRPAADAAGPSVTEQLLPRGYAPPLHMHEREDEIFHLLEGEMRLRVGEDEVVVRPGDTLLAPRGVPHGFRVESELARVLVITTAGDFEAMMREVAQPAGAGPPEAAEPTPEMAEALTAACARHHIAVVGPPMA